MNELRFEVKVTAVGEVRDADGNLLSTSPVESTMEVTADELAQMGLFEPTEENQS